MAITYEPIATTTLGSAQANITFNSISGTYTDLVLIFNGGTSVAGEDLVIQFNSDTNGANYSSTWLRGNGTAAASGRQSSNAVLDWSGNSTAVENNAIVSIQNYSNSTTYKTYVARHAGSGYGTDAVVGLWKNTNAITTVLIKANSGNLISGSVATLYGIKAA